MSITTVLFDLDGTLLPMDQDAFTKGYFRLLAKKLSFHGYEPEKLVNAIWAGTAAMVKNDGSKSNENIFWDKFSQAYGDKVLSDKPLFDEFYKNEFIGARKFCSFNPKASETVRKLRNMGYRVSLATNPIFPSTATEARIRWVGLEPSEFELYTSYESIGFCKPNTEYYREIIDRLQVKPEECLMVGNDVDEDMVAQKLGINVFLLTDCLINKNGADISTFPRGSYDNLLRYIGER